MYKPCNQVCPYNTLRGCTILEHPGQYCPMGNMPKKENKPHTNADRFRNMTDEEQQRFVKGFFEIEDFADWLKQPAKEET